jgi:hypothetical protein
MHLRENNTPTAKALRYRMRENTLRVRSQICPLSLSEPHHATSTNAFYLSILHAAVTILCCFASIVNDYCRGLCFLSCSSTAKSCRPYAYQGGPTIGGTSACSANNRQSPRAHPCRMVVFQIFKRRTTGVLTIAAVASCCWHDVVLVICGQHLYSSNKFTQRHRQPIWVRRQ